MPKQRIPTITRAKQEGHIACPTCKASRKGTRELLRDECTVNRHVYGECQWLDCGEWPRVDVDPQTDGYVLRARGRVPQKFPWQDGVQLVIPGVEGNGVDGSR